MIVQPFSSFCFPGCGWNWVRLGVKPGAKISETAKNAQKSANCAENRVFDLAGQCPIFSQPLSWTPPLGSLKDVLVGAGEGGRPSNPYLLCVGKGPPKDFDTAWVVLFSWPLFQRQTQSFLPPPSMQNRNRPPEVGLRALFKFFFYPCCGFLFFGLTWPADVLACEPAPPPPVGCRPAWPHFQMWLRGVHIWVSDSDSDSDTGLCCRVCFCLTLAILFALLEGEAAPVLPPPPVWNTACADPSRPMWVSGLFFPSLCLNHTIA